MEAPKEREHFSNLTGDSHSNEATVRKKGKTRIGSNQQLGQRNYLAKASTLALTKKKILAAVDGAE
jgi:hypothetical protein